MRQPLREAVSWNGNIRTTIIDGEPSASSWGCELKWLLSWTALRSAFWSASSWGCELKYQISIAFIQSSGVSLFVRLWVEITGSRNCHNRKPVSLFVRLWVEIAHDRSYEYHHKVSLFVRLWVEMSWRHWWFYPFQRQPLREAVSWNYRIRRTQNVNQVSLFVRLWVEMLICPRIYPFGVSSASSWGCELKYCQSTKCWCLISQPLREAVSWNLFRINQSPVVCRQPLREAVSWNISKLS